MERVVISNETDALALLQDVVKSRLSAVPQIEFVGFPKLQLRYTGDQFDQSITPSLMKVFIEIQRDFLRAYCLAKYESSDTTHLTQEERKALEFVVKIEKGSTLAEIDFTDILNKAASSAITKMEPTHIVTVILGVSLLYFGTAMFKHYVDTRSKERMERDRSDQLKSMMSGIVELKKEEVRIVEAVSSLAKAEPVLQELKELSDTMHGRLVKAAGLSDAGTVQGVTMDGDAAKELARNPRHEPVERTLYWNCTVQKVDASKPDRFTVRLLGEGNSAPVDTEIPDTELNDDLKRTIQKAEWSRQLLRVVILARYINDKLDKAELIGAEEIRPDKPGPDSDPVVAS